MTSVATMAEIRTRNAISGVGGWTRRKVTSFAATYKLLMHNMKRLF